MQTKNDFLILRDYQIELSDKAKIILDKYKIVYLAMEMRTGKTTTAMETIKKYGAKKVLFLTKKNAISSIEKDYNNYKNDFILTLINYESIHKLENDDFDLLVLDEAHSKLATFPKQSKTNKEIKSKYSHLPIIYLSGTPLIESNSKIFHQFFISKYSPFIQYKNFYAWFKNYGIPKLIYTSYGTANDYSNSKYEDIMNDIKHLFITYTQEEAGFASKINEKILYVKMKDKTYSICDRLIKNKVVEGKTETILADTGVKLQISLCQLYSGTIKTESGNSLIIDDSKALFIQNYFKGKKIAILYYFIKEKELLAEIFGESITFDLNEFKTTKKSFAGQITSNREGVNLSEAEALIFFNIPFSGTSFVQGRERMNNIGRKENNVYIICAEGGIEEKIYKVVKEKKNYNNKIFQKDYARK